MLTLFTAFYKRNRMFNKNIKRKIRILRRLNSRRLHEQKINLKKKSLYRKKDLYVRKNILTKLKKTENNVVFLKVPHVIKALQKSRRYYNKLFRYSRFFMHFIKKIMLTRSVIWRRKPKNKRIPYFLTNITVYKTDIKDNIGSLLLSKPSLFLKLNKIL
jgi:hypothetical protein